MILMMMKMKMKRKRGFRFGFEEVWWNLSLEAPFHVGCLGSGYLVKMG